MTEIKLTQFSHGAGCGCKISPSVLETILHSETVRRHTPQLLVGYETKDDAAVFDLGNGQCIISTTDFFMPIVDDAFDFGAIASVNAISDVYAMGGKPLLALAILGWPVDKLAPALAQRVLDGSRKVCEQAGIPLAGGHSIDSPEPIFGLAVTGIVDKPNIKRNDTAKAGDIIYLTKPIGVGIITTAQKRGLAKSEDVQEAVQIMTQLNIAGEEFGRLTFVSAMTDITGFGLLGHLIEVCEGSGLSAELDYKRVPLIPSVSEYVSKMIYPDNTMRNWSSYQAKTKGIGAESLLTLCDPQTSGGLLVCVDASRKKEFESKAASLKYPLYEVGRMVVRNESIVTIYEPAVS
ncbi:MAG: selenide, water dikinase SelD [Cytophagales bacterium]|mgnify:CR=1 FL=1|nr:selenide, water dikinase SelD [Cytophagales bacterium]